MSCRDDALFHVASHHIVAQRGTKPFDAQTNVALRTTATNAAPQCPPAELRIDSGNRKSGHGRDSEETVACADRREAAQEFKELSGTALRDADQ